MIKPKSGSEPVVRNSRPAADRLAMIVNAPRSVVFQLFIGLFLSLIVPPNGEESDDANGKSKD